MIGILPALTPLPEPPDDLLRSAGFVGSVTGGILGWWFARLTRRVTWPESILVAFGMATTAVVLGAVLVGAWIGVSSVGRAGPLEIAAAMVMLPFMGILFYGAGAFVLALPCAAGWVIVMRLLPDRIIG